MRTKHLLMTMALPLAFAACTSDEFESFNNQGEALKNRKDLGQVALMFEGDAQTRWTESLGAEIGDRVGAVLIDQLNDGVYDEEDPMSNYTISPSQVFSNYMYENDGTAWRTNANLVEGSYYFYAPYVAHQGRGLIKLNTPVVQTIDVDADGNIEPNSGIANFAKAAETPFVIGYKFLASTDDNTDVTISMKHLFAYPEIKFTNNSGEAVTLSRVLIQNTGDGFVASGDLNNNAIGGASGKLFITGEQDRKSIEAAKELGEAYDPAKDPTGENEPEFLSWGEWSKVFAYDEGGQTIPDGLDDLTTAILLTNTTSTELIRIDFSENVVVADKETVSFRVVMPADTYDTKDLSLWFVVPSGKAYQVAMENNKQSEAQITTMLQDRYTGQDYTSKGLLKTGAKQFEVAIGKDATLEDAPSVVTTTEALIDLLEYEKSNTGTLNVTLAGSNIEFNQDVLDAIANIKSQSVKFSGIINIVGSKDNKKPMVIDEEVIFDQAIVKEGYTTFSNDGLGFGNVTIEKDATLNVNDIKATENKPNGYEQGVITNKGNLVVGDATIDKVENYGSVTFAGKGTISELVDRSSDETVLTITVDEGAEYEYDAEAKYNVINNGTLTVPANAVIAGDITNNGVIELDGAATNMGVLTNAAGAEINGDGTLNNKGTLTNSGVVNCDVTNGNPAEDDAEEGTTYTITAKSGSQFMGKVSGTAKNAETNSFVVESNAILTDVENTNLAVVYNEDELNEKTMLPKMVGKETSIINTLNVTKVNLTDDEETWTAGKAYAEAVEVINVNGNMNIAKDVTWTLPASVTDMNIEANCQITGEGTLKFASSEEANLNIAAGTKLTLVGGTIDGGDKKVEMVSEEDEDEVLTRGQFEGINGYLNNVEWTDGNWFKNSGVNGTVGSNAEINNNGTYKLAASAKVSGFGEGVTNVKFVADGENKAVTLVKGLVGGDINRIIELGEGVEITLGEDTDDYDGVKNIGKVIIGAENTKLIVKRDGGEDTLTWKNGSWSRF